MLTEVKNKMPEQIGPLADMATNNVYAVMSSYVGTGQSDEFCNRVILAKTIVFEPVQT